MAGKAQQEKSLTRRHVQNNDGSSSDSKARIYVYVFAIGALFLLIHILALSGGGSSNNNNLKNKEPRVKSNRFSYSSIKSPYEQIWINSQLPGWAKKRKEFRKIEKTTPPADRLCYVHVGKAGGSSVGCGLGFSLHCSNSTQEPLGGLLPRRATRMFHADTYDCRDDAAYYLFVVRDPVERIKSAFLYDRPLSESSLKRRFPEYYERRKNFYLDCPSFGVMESLVQDGLTKHGKASDVCKIRAFTAFRGERHFSCHMYFNYQFHLEGIPEDGRILVIRNEHLVRDWNSAEHHVGGEMEIIPRGEEEANSTIKVMNKSTKDGRDKWLSEESTRIVCRQLCNEIVSYKKILRRALNLNYQEIERSMEELRHSCPEYADHEEGDCPFPMPDIKEKLINTRGYEDMVMEDSYTVNKEKLENTMHPKRKDDEEEAEDLMDDDGYSLPYSV